MKKKSIVASVVSIAVCSSIVAGSTYALFTSKSDVNIAITSGNVELVASLHKSETEDWIYSPTLISTAAGNAIVDATNAANVETGFFANEGEAVVEDGQLTVSGMTPGDKVSLYVDVQNNSNVAIKYRTVVTAAVAGEESTQTLTDALSISVRGEQYVGEEVQTTWLPIAANGEVADIPVVIEMPTTVSDSYKDQTVTFDIGVEAVQANADTEVTAEAAATAADLMELLGSYSDQSGDLTISLTQDIDVAGEWTAYTFSGYSGVNTLTIEGNGNTIYNLNEPLFVGTFAGAGAIIINNLTIEDANISHAKYGGLGVGAFFANSDHSGSVQMNNCKLINSNVECTDGYAGGLFGYTSTPATITNCQVIGCEITGANSTGAIAGQFAASATVTGCTVTGNTLTSSDDGDWRVGAIVGTANVGTVTLSSITAENITCSQLNKEAPDHSNLYGRKVNDTTITLEGNEI